MDYISRPYTHSTVYKKRPIVGVVWHDTEGTTPLTTFQSGGSWHWLIDRDGTLYRDVVEGRAAWHVQATGHTAESVALTRWRPPWLIVCPDGRVSDANYCCIGIEMVSAAVFRAQGVPFTEAQYATARVLTVDIEERYGRLWHVGHGLLQTDRTDPVQYDWARAGMVWSDDGYGYRYTPEENPMAILNDAELLEAANKAWGELRGVPCNPDSGFYKAWRDELRAGRYKGLPVAGELGTTFGTTQCFDQGMAVWKAGKPVSWDG